MGKLQALRAPGKRVFLIWLTYFAAEDAVVPNELDNLSAEDAEDAEYYWVCGFVDRYHFVVLA